MPWWQTFFMLVLWEVLEAYWTVGLGDGESLENHIVDVVVAVVGWWIVILLFPRSRKDIPWISSRNSCGNEGKCCFTLVPSKDEVANSSIGGGQTYNTYSTVHV